MASAVEAGAPALGAARKARGRKRRSLARHVLWLHGLCQGHVAHHTAVPEPSPEGQDDQIAQVRLALQSLRDEVAVLRGVVHGLGKANPAAATSATVKEEKMYKQQDKDKHEQQHSLHLESRAVANDLDKAYRNLIHAASSSQAPGLARLQGEEYKHKAQYVKLEEEDDDGPLGSPWDWPELPPIIKDRQGHKDYGNSDEEINKQEGSEESNAGGKAAEDKSLQDALELARAVLAGPALSTTGAADRLHDSHLGLKRCRR